MWQHPLPQLPVAELSTEEETTAGPLQAGKSPVVTRPVWGSGRGHQLRQLRREHPPWSASQWPYTGFRLKGRVLAVELGLSPKRKEGTCVTCCTTRFLYSNVHLFFSQECIIFPLPLRVYGRAELQNVVFEDVCTLLTSFLDGYNVCILAYGRTGSGKSFTTLGPRSREEPAPLSESFGDSGIVPRATGGPFRLIPEDPSRSPEVEVFTVEVYNNDVSDLLANDRCREASGSEPQCGGARDARGGVRSSAAQAATAAPADFSRSHLLTAVPRPQPLPPQQRRAAVCARSVACNRKPRGDAKLRAIMGVAQARGTWLRRCRAWGLKPEQAPQESEAIQPPENSGEGEVDASFSPLKCASWHCL
ncbi:hypothetical protein EI555_001377 [Monodon monoceros]|uniref:Kinesin motor domain-containing protein n=1 Tax=Monodon monoceros TaxID=40151 RepID=A0A4U1FLE9_MONMO|nr:hypothetical protein EI555_001377 [Monodon monoceros]